MCQVQHLMLVSLPAGCLALCVVHMTQEQDEHACQHAAHAA
jgi:hypothetical protein